jgi:hypothetical protein
MYSGKIIDELIALVARVESAAHYDLLEAEPASEAPVAYLPEYAHELAVM